MPMGNETNHVMDGLTVRGGLQVGANGPFLAPNTMLEGLMNWRSPGIEVPHRLFVSASTAAVSQQLRLAFFTAPFDYPSTTCEFGSGTTAAAATPTICRYGLYLMDQTSLGGTLVASTTNDTALFVGTSTRYPKAWTTPYTLVGGARYGVGYLVVSGAALPTIPGCVSPGVGAVQNARPYLAATIGSQSDLPLTFLDSGLANTTVTPYAFIS